MAQKTKQPAQSYDDLSERVTYLEGYVEHLQHVIQGANRQRFGQKSEAFPDSSNLLFPFMEGAEPSKKALDPIVDVDEPKPKKKPKKNSSLPVEVIIIPVSDEDKLCACGLEKAVIRHEISKRIHYIPAVYKIIEEHREVVACTAQCLGAMITAPAPKRMLPNIGITEDFLAHMIIAKMDDRQPLYHLEKKFKSRFGLSISRQNMARWIIRCSQAFMPLYNLMKDVIIEHDVASMDATTLQVLDEPGRLATTKSYVYCYRGGVDQKVILYDYNESDHQHYVAQWFDGFKGCIHSDADSFFKLIYQDDAIHAVNCNAHARRKFEAIAKQSKKRGLAHHAMKVYADLYKIERKAKNESMSPDQIKILRQTHAVPIIKEYRLWLEQKSLLAPKGSPIFKAMRYVLNNWDGLIKYCDDGRLKIDNNHTERAIKPFVIARKNFMFSKSQAGARALCMHFSLIRTAKAHQLDPYAYLSHVMKRMPHCKTVEDYEALLPWNVQIDRVAE